MVIAHAFFAVLAAVQAGQVAPPATAKKRPNLLVVTFDTTRRDYMGFMGKTPSPTPFLDSLAQQSVVFEDAYTVAPLTLPAHTSLFTGLYPRSHGVHDNGNFKVPSSATTLAEILKRHGYATGAAVSSFVLDPMFELDQGFDSYDSTEVQGSGRVMLTQRRADAMVDQALKDLPRLAAKNGGGPWFYWLHCFDPHFPYDPPVAPMVPAGMKVSDAGWDKIAYTGELQYADSQFGRLLGELNRRGLLNDLVIVFAADHGESLRDAPEASHGYYLFDPTVRIPLMVRMPGLAPRRVTTQASLVDVVPTLLDLLQIDEPELAFDGLDLAPWMKEPGRDGPPEPPDRALLLECWYGWLNYGWAPFDGCVQSTLKHLRAKRPQLFERAADPGEQHDLWNPDDPRCAGLARRLDALCSAQEHRLEHDTLALSGADLARLMHLGYAASTARAEDPPPGADLPDPYDKIDVVRALEDVTQARVDNDRDRVLALLRGLAEKEPQSADIQADLGIELANRGPEFLLEAERRLRAALKIDPRRSRAHFAIGVCADRRADLIRAELKKARDEGATREELKKQIVEERHQTHRAIRAYKACLEFEPNYPDGIERLVRLLREDAERLVRSGDDAEALDNLHEAVKWLDHWLTFLPPGDNDIAAVTGNKAWLTKRIAELTGPEKEKK